MMKPIKGYDGLYEISDTGVIHNLKTGNELHGNVNSYGYRVVRLCKDGKPKDFKLHQLLATTFIQNPNNYRCINHIDGNKLNNFLDNLEWCTRAYNNQHAREQLSLDFSRKAVVQSTLDGKFIAVWRSPSIAAHYINGEQLLISACCKGTATTAYGCKWKYSDRLLSDF